MSSDGSNSEEEYYKPTFLAIKPRKPKLFEGLKDIYYDEIEPIIFGCNKYPYKFRTSHPSPSEPPPPGSGNNAQSEEKATDTSNGDANDEGKPSNA